MNVKESLEIVFTSFRSNFEGLLEEVVSHLISKTTESILGLEPHRNAATTATWQP